MGTAAAERSSRRVDLVDIVAAFDLVAAELLALIEETPPRWTTMSTAAAATPTRKVKFAM